MPYFPDLNTYLHQSSLLLQAYPSSTRITTKYSLPRKPSANSKAKSNAKSDTETETTAAALKRDPSATLILKTFEADSGICLKYKTDKAAEVGRLMVGLGRLAKGEIIEMPTSAPAAHEEQQGDKMEVDGGAGSGPGTGTATPRVEEKVAVGGGGGKSKKKKGKK